MASFNSALLNMLTHSQLYKPPRLSVYLFVYLWLGFTFIIALVPSVNAQPDEHNTHKDWLIQPQACIVQSLGDECKIEITVALPKLDSGEYCYYKNQQRLNCFDYQTPVLELKLSFRENTIISLRDASQETVFSQSLEIKTRESKQKVRRVRDPWSFF